MPIDLVCGQCSGRFLAEEPGSVVACPHCGAHLQVPSASTPDVAAGSTSVDELTPPRATQSPPDGSLVTVSDAMMVEEPSRILLEPAGLTPLSELPSHSTPRMTLPVVAAAPTAEPSPKSRNGEATPFPGVEASASTANATVPKFWFLVLASYASAITLAFLFLLLLLSRMKTHPLENLPDVVPKIQNGEVALEVAPPQADVPRLHVLPLGTTRRFGSVNVTPLRVTAGPLRFEHVLRDPTAARAASEPVLKLWLRFENVSGAQTFSPLDGLLLFKRHYQDAGTVLTNQFLCRAEERRRGGDLRYVFGLSPSSEFQIQGQNLGAVLRPGESVEMFVPSEEGIDDLTGRLVWRVHFRKGYHPWTRHGVTTLIDVPFRRDDVQTES